MAEKIDFRPKVLELVRKNGPVVPRDLAKEIGTDTFIIGAVLMRLKDEGLILVSNTKIGGSPAYYAPGQEESLQLLSNFLNEKDRYAYELIKKYNVLREKDLEPGVSDSIRKIKDFAVRLVVDVKGHDEIFWKWYLTPLDFTEQVIVEMIKNDPEPEQIVEEKVEEVAEASKEIERMAEELIESAINEEMQKLNDNITEKVSEEMIDEKAEPEYEEIYQAERQETIQEAIESLPVTEEVNEEKQDIIDLPEAQQEKILEASESQEMSKTNEKETYISAAQESHDTKKEAADSKQFSEDENQEIINLPAEKQETISEAAESWPVIEEVNEERQETIQEEAESKNSIEDEKETIDGKNEEESLPKIIPEEPSYDDIEQSKEFSEEIRKIEEIKQEKKTDDKPTKILKEKTKALKKRRTTKKISKAKKNIAKKEKEQKEKGFFSSIKRLFR